MILYADREKKDCVYSILSKPGMSRDHQVDRILSIDLEQKNKILADHIIPSDASGDFTRAVSFIRSIL